MVDVIVKITGLVVVAVALVNLAQGALVIARLVAHVTRRYPHLRLDLWFPRQVASHVRTSCVSDHRGNQRSSRRCG